MNRLLKAGNMTAAILLACALLVSLVAIASAAPVASGASPTVQTTVLSNDTTNTTWALANHTARIRAQPSTHARAIAKLRFGTPDGLGLQTYLLMSQQTTPSGAWVKVRVPGRPNGRIGWVQRGALGDFQLVHTRLVINRAARQLRLYRNGKAIFHAPVGVGKPSTPTPPGHFWITEAFRSADPAYGPYAFGTTAYSSLSEWPGGGVVGLHGTNEPWLVPGAPSHGCIRVHNSDILRLKKLVPIGTPVWIR